MIHNKLNNFSKIYKTLEIIIRIFFVYVSLINLYYISKNIISYSSILQNIN